MNTKLYYRFCPHQAPSGYQWTGLKYTMGGPLAQLAEQRTFNPWVVGSSPTGPTSGKQDRAAHGTSAKTQHRLLHP